MKKILIANGHLNVGGVEKSLVNLLRTIDYERYSVDLLLFEGLGDYLDQIPDNVHILDWNLTETYGSAFQAIRRTLKQGNLRLAYTKIVLAASEKFGLPCLKALRLLRVTPDHYDYAIAYRVGMSADYISFVAVAKKKEIWWHHGEFAYAPAMVERWRAEFRCVDRIVCVSDYTRNLIRPYFPEFSEKTCVIPNTVNAEEIRRGAVCFNPYSAEKGRRILVSVGRFSMEKHMIDCVTVAHMLKNDGLLFTWYLIGDGDERAEIETRIKDLGVEDCVVLTGTQSNPYPYIRYADLFVHPSHVESQGIVVLEAMALGKPCIVVSSGGTDEFVRDNRNAIQAGRSIESLYEKVSYALRNLESLDFTEEEAKTVCRFSPEHVVQLIFD